MLSKRWFWFLIYMSIITIPVLSPVLATYIPQVPPHIHLSGDFSGGNNGNVFYKAAGLWVSGTPDAAGLVATSGDQSIAGVKTFTSIPLGPGNNPTTDNQLARKAYVDLMLPLAGGTMSGNIAMNSHKVTGLAAASAAGEALRYDEWIAAQDPGHKHSKLWASDGSPEAVTVDASGNVGIGTTTPSSPLQVFATNAKSATGNWHADIKDNTALAAGVGGGLQFSGRTTDAPGYEQYAGIQGYKTNATSNDRKGQLRFSTQFDGSGLVTRMTIDESGNVGIGTTNPGYKLTCNGEPGANGYTAWTNYSDVRFKQDIKPLDDDILVKVLKLNPVTFSYNDKNPWGEKPGERRLYGLIAQELQAIFPDMVGEAQGPDGEKYLTTNLSNLTLYLVQAIKEQQGQIETLRAQIELLKVKN